MKRIKSLIQLATILLLQVFFLWSCTNHKNAPPFPVNENEYLQPERKDFTLSEPDTLSWTIQDPSKIKPLPTTKFDWDKLPTKNFDLRVPKKLEKPLKGQAFNWDSLPRMPFSLDSLPKAELKVKVTALGNPKIVKAGYFESAPNASHGVMTIGSNFGLPSPVYSQMMDSDGMVWFGTGSGIARYDGQNLEIYGIDQGIDTKYIGRLYEDSKGRIWLLGGGGVSFIDRRVGLIYELSSKFVSEGAYEIFESRDGLFWLDNGGVGYDIIDLEGNSIRQFKPEHGLLGEFMGPVCQDLDGLLWLGTHNGINVIDLDAGINVKIPKGTIPGSEEIFSFLSDDKGRLWLAGKNEVYILNDSKTEVKTFSANNGLVLKDEMVTEIYQDSAGKFWIASQFSGVYCFDLEKENLASFKLNENLSNQWIFNLIEDQNGDMWVIRAQGGVFKIDRNNGSPGNYETSDGLGDKNVWSTLEASDGKIWLGTHGGIDVYDPVSETLKHLGEKDGLVSDMNRTLMEDSKGRIWAGYNQNGGVSIIDPKRGTIKKLTPNEGLQATAIRSMIEDEDGVVWMGSNNNGVLTVDLEKSIFKKLLAKDSLENVGRINRVIQDENNQIWIASHNYGLSIIDAKNNSRRRLNANNGLISDLVFSIAKDKKDHIWAATDLGVQLIDMENLELTTFTELEGLGSNDVYDVIDHNGQMYLGSAQGLTLVEQEAGVLKDDVVWKSKTLSNRQGLNYFDFAQNSFSIDSKGRLWTGTGGPTGAENLLVLEEIKEDSTRFASQITGINILDKKQSYKNNDLIRKKVDLIDTLWVRGKNEFYTVDKAAIDSMYVAQNEIEWDSINGPYDLPSGLKLPYTQNYLSFTFNGMQLDNPDKIVYRYILEGIDKTWSPITKNTISENYRDLPPGDYNFMVASKGFNGVWSKPAELSFTILPPWWKTWWAYAIFTALFLGLGLIILNYRSRWLKEENRILEEKVNERTSELKKTISELENTQSQLIQSEKMASLGELTAGIAHEIQNPMNFINNFSEVTTELVGEMCEELDKGDAEEAKDISKDIVQNLEKISHHGKRASSIVRGMLEHSRNSSGHKELIDINVLADEYLRLAYHGLRAKDKGFNADFQTDLDETLPKVEIMAQDMGRVILNIINNAFFAVTSVPETERAEGYQPLVTVRTKNLGDQALISIKDNGPGIPAEIKDKIFQPFFTTKPTGKGTGLGLSLAYDIVTTGHGGAIELNTAPGEGTEFVIYIPINKQ